MTSMHPLGAREHAEVAIRERMRAGRWAVGEALVASAVASEIKLSASPVREALAALHGEGVLDARHRDGYSMPRLMAHELADAYFLVGLVTQGLTSRLSPGTIAPETGLRPHERAERFSQALAGGARSPAAGAFLARFDLRLLPYRQAEEMVFEDWEAEIGRLETLLENHATAELRRAIGRYHNRRMKAAGALCEQAEL